MKTDKFVFFWGGPFSQWFKRDMVINGTTYNCAEQYMMAMKATFFGDDEALRKVMKYSNPKDQKAVGRGVKNFNAEAWNSICRKFVYEANYVKFSDPAMKSTLMETGDLEIVEASPFDTVWGIGLGEDDPRILDKSQWRGTNWLGEELMNVRKALK